MPGSTTAALLAHVGPLGHHDLWLIIPMAVLSAVIMVVMARPRQPPPDDEPEDHRATPSSSSS